MNKKYERKMDKIERLLNSSKTNDIEKDLITDFKHFIKEYKHLSFNQTKALNNIYHKYFINIDQSKKQNKSLEDF